MKSTKHMSRKEHLVRKEISELDIASVLTATQTVHATADSLSEDQCIDHVKVVKVFLCTGTLPNKLSHFQHLLGENVCTFQTESR